MPAPITYAHQLLQHAATLRKNGDITWMRPDSKSQVTVEYEGHTPRRIDTVVISHQHDPDVAYDELRETVIDEVIKPILEPTGLLDEATRYFVNPTGRFVIVGVRVPPCGPVRELRRTPRRYGPHRPQDHR